MPIVVIEGPDGVGKSTLAQEFVKRGYRYHHHSHKDASTIEFYTQLLLDARGQNVVFDRLYPSEIVYGPVMRKGSRISIEQLRLLNRLLFSLGGTVVFCTTRFETAKENWKVRLGSEYVKNAEKLFSIYTRYTELKHVEYGCGSSYTYDYQNRPASPFSNISSCLLSYINFMDEYNKAPNGVIGNHHMGKFLIVGEQSADPSDLAFYTDEPKRAGHFLSRCLWEAGYREHEMAFTNALRYDGQARNIRDIYLARPKVVITLGVVAHTTCSRQGVPHLVADHPQFVKRFKLKQRDKYVALLRRFRTGEVGDSKG